MPNGTLSPACRALLTNSATVTDVSPSRDTSSRYPRIGLFGLLILRHDRREILWLGVTAHPTTEWMAQQVREAIGWDKPPKYLLRDRDRVYGDAFMSRIRAMGIRDRPTAARSPWQNGYCERAIGSI